MRRFNIPRFLLGFKQKIPALLRLVSGRALLCQTPIISFLMRRIAGREATQEGDGKKHCVWGPVDKFVLWFKEKTKPQSRKTERKDRVGLPER